VRPAIASEPARERAGRRRVAGLAAVLASAWVAACASTGERPGRAVSVPRQARPEVAEREASSREEFDAGLAEMASAIQRGDCERALVVGDQMLRKKPPAEVRTQIERLRKAARQQLLQAFYLDAVVRAERPRVTLGERIKGEVTLINVGTERLVIEDASGNPALGASRTLLHLEVGYREFSPDGTLVRETLSSNVVVGRRITLAPGARFSIPLELDTLEQNPGGSTLRHYDIGGSVILAELRTGEDVMYGQVELKPARVQVFPRNWEHLADDPVARLSDAIRRRSPPHVPLAAALVPEARRTEALGALRQALREGSADGPDPATLRACCVALNVLTGEDRNPDPKSWLARLDEILQ
jgi:hypothetical protein